MFATNNEGRHEVLPETLDIFRIAEMQPADLRFARTYAMWVTHDRRLWLDSTHPTSPEPTTDMPMMVFRTEEGWCVDVSDVPDAAWETEDPETFDELYGDDVEWLPVAHLVNMPEAQ